MLTVNAILKGLEKKSFEKEGRTIEFLSAKVIIEGCDYPCYISVKTDKDINSFKLDSNIKLAINIGAYNYKPVYKYTIL